MYDSFSNDYDRFVNWQNRLGFEMPFIERELRSAGLEPGARVLDAACGTGMHAIALARRGYRAAGADFSAGMISRARENASEAGVDIPFVPVGFGQIAAAFRESRDGLFPFDAVLCLGNSLPHLLTKQELAAALEDFGACLRSGGLLVIQNRNFDAVVKKHERWMEPQAHRESRPASATGGLPQEGIIDEVEWVFLRFYDYRPDGLIDFNIVTLRREGNAAWQQRVTSTTLYPLRQAELTEALEQAGFTHIQIYGGLDGTAFDAETSGNLVIAARCK